MKLSKALERTLAELERAKAKHPNAFVNGHEGWAVLQEEVEELWDLVKRDANKSEQAKEAIQVAAMALRYLEELC